MSKAKSVVISVILALIMLVAAFFAFVSFPVSNSVKRYNSILSNIHMGADFTGYAYATIYPEGVYTSEEYESFVADYEADKDNVTDPSTLYTECGSVYIKNETYAEGDTLTDAEIASLKESVTVDAESLNKRFGEKGYSSYSVAVEDGLAIKISVPTNFSVAEYRGDSGDSRSTTLSTASYSISRLISDGELTLRTADSSIGSKDEWTDKISVTNSDDETVSSYTLFKDDVSQYFKSITGGTIGSTPVITFNFTSDGREAFNEVTTSVAASDEQTIYFYVGESQLVAYTCSSAVDSNSLQLQATDSDTAEDVAIAMNSAISGGALTLTYRSLESVIASQAPLGDYSSLLMFIAFILILVGICVFLIVKYKKLGLVTSVMVFFMMLVEVYALNILSIQVTMPVVIVCALLIGLYVISCITVYEDVRRKTSGGRTVQASVKDAYKSVIMTVTDIHIVLVVLAILFAAIGVGEVFSCGLISVIGVVASYVLYWFTRFLWYVASGPVNDKFKFAGFKRVVYEDD